ncbi:rRNA maturation RNase YbeY [Desulfarculus baarsii]|uniref:rRNA maturation RNase YbeY n=1 Tax=Desulfarculus baarsii TaxID=453230 RepID=UPI001FE1E649|nr:rRNA maturation RNase YbeY [Desulfarculus baarsii]
MALAEDAELSLLICDDVEIAQINGQYLDRRGPTNVLAFAMQEGDGAGVNPQILGDVVVSIDTAQREAAENGLDPDEHFVRLIIHGLLHLLGHDHLRDEEQARAMEELTEDLLEKSAAASERICHGPTVG